MQDTPGANLTCGPYNDLVVGGRKEKVEWGEKNHDTIGLGQIVEKPRGDLEKVLPREDLKPRDVPKANPRAQPESLPSEYPEAFRFSRGGTFFRYHPRLFHNLSDFGFLEVQGSLPRDHYGKILVNPQ